jgi:primosomal protein N' (replication factor Y)
VGEGSERVEQALRDHLPGARIERMDRDTVRRREQQERLLRRFEAGDVDVLVGTQMVAKGHDFPNVTVVGVLAADQSLGLCDFRAGERTFQLLTQVAGRAGRGERPGVVVLQAFDPTHPVIELAVAQDYESFFEREAQYRGVLRFPPFSSLVSLLVSDRDAGRADEIADLVARAVRESGGDRLRVRGPGPAPVERLRGRTRRQILVASAGRRKLIDAVRTALDALEGTIPSGILQVDVDPYSLL